MTNTLHCAACGQPWSIHRDRHHYFWDRAIEPALRAPPGQELELDVHDAAAGRYHAGSTVADLLTQDPARVNPVTGPVFVEGAEPGDGLVVELLSFEPSGFGWSGNFPGFGLLAEQFPEPALRLWHYDTTARLPAALGRWAQVPLAPFAGTIGVAPASASPESVRPPTRRGGNLDLRDAVAGSRLVLPVQVTGALLSLGDTHAAQGDGEVCGTAIESAMKVHLRLQLLKGGAPPAPRLQRARPAQPAVQELLVTTGVGHDVMSAARDAVSAMIDQLCARTGMPAVDAYILCSCAGHLRLAQVVNVPNVTVAFELPFDLLMG